MAGNAQQARLSAAGQASASLEVLISENRALKLQIERLQVQLQDANGNAARLTALEAKNEEMENLVRILDTKYNTMKAKKKKLKNELRKFKHRMENVLQSDPDDDEPQDVEDGVVGGNEEI